MKLADWLDANERTDAWLAEQVGRDRTVITKIKNGKGQPSLEIAVAIERATNGEVRPASLLAEAVIQEAR